MASTASGLSLYLDYVQRAGDRLDEFRALARWRRFKRVLYPGSYVHVTPSLVFPDVTYNDADRRTPRFFEDEHVRQYVREHREYRPEPRMEFWYGDYAELPDAEGGFDLLISQYAGLVSQACAQLLAPAGVLYANDSHGDATLAYFDDRYESSASSREGRCVRAHSTGISARGGVVCQPGNRCWPTDAAPGIASKQRATSSAGLNALRGWIDPLPFG